MSDRTSLISQCQQLNAQGKNQEDIVAFLRAQGCSKVESIIVLVEAQGIEMNEAKKIVHLSQAWADRRERDDQFHKSLEKALEQYPEQ